MIEKEMEDLLWNYPEKFFHEPLKQHSRQQRSAIGRSDLIFVDRVNRLLVVELKKGKLGREAVAQIVDYFGMIKSQFPGKPIEMMLVAHVIPEERRLACEHYNIDPREIPEKRFRDVAEEVGYQFESEKTIPVEQRSEVSVSGESTRIPRLPPNTSERAGRSYAAYQLDPSFNRNNLAQLIAEFSSVVRRHIDKSLAENLKRELLDRNPPRISRGTIQQLARWCNTNSPVYWDGMEVAKKISNVLFGCVIDRNQLGT